MFPVGITKVDILFLSANFSGYFFEILLYFAIKTLQIPTYHNRFEALKTIKKENHNLVVVLYIFRKN